MPIRVGIIGAGVASGCHIESLQAIPGVEVAAIADSNRQTLQRQSQNYGIKMQLPDHKLMLDDKRIDAIYVCVPHYLHRKMVIEALGAGKHVVCEKPLSMNAREAEHMIKASEDTGCRLFVAENHRFIPENIMAREMIKDGSIGRPFMCMSCFIGDETERMNDPANWKGTKEKCGGGVIIDNGFHMLDTLRCFFGEVESVSASAGRMVTKAENKEEDTALITLFFASGLLAELSLTFGARDSGFPADYVGAAIRYDIYGTDGSVHLLNERDSALTLVKKGKRRVMSIRDITDKLPAGAPTDMNRHFIDCILNGTEPVVSAWDACQVMRIIDACYESVKRGSRVSIQNKPARTKPAVV